jgi:hypothetical protein
MLVMQRTWLQRRRVQGRHGALPVTTTWREQ